ncbi:unnamed protein product [Brassicogethes aeneus]|uniref:Uncharacterized protein n=1 Tax=Brassicogethes aeneus TaxID=1431903 RepID=A0A9P0AVJ5_BRAAE|nr:unnamed protein product [Brassicogethes aeneus]
MALQLNKICRGLIQNGQKILASKAETVCPKEVHSECTPQSVNIINDVHSAGKVLESLPSLLSKLPSAESPIRSYSSKCGVPKQTPKCNNQKCKQNKCPRFYLEGCDCPVYCKKKIIYCKKRPAPYPSYSEACAEELDENPSECVQCPWKHCPDFKVTYRKYHTGKGLAAAPFKDTMSTPLILDPELLKDELYAYKNKKPCERPCSPCEKRRMLIERLRREKEQRECEERKKKKCAPAWTEAVRLVANRDVAMLDPLEALEDLEEPEDAQSRVALFNRKRKPPNRDCGDDYKYRCPDGTYEAFEYDPREANYEHKRRRRSGATDKPCCTPEGKRRKVPDCGEGCTCAAHNAPSAQATMSLCEQLNYELAKVNSGHDKCPPRKHKYPDVDKTIDLVRMCDRECPPPKKRKIPKQYPNPDDYPAPMCPGSCPPKCPNYCPDAATKKKFEDPCDCPLKVKYHRGWKPRVHGGKGKGKIIRRCKNTVYTPGGDDPYGPGRQY